MRSCVAIIGPYWFQEPIAMYAGGDGTHCRRHHHHFLSIHSLATWPSTGEVLHCKCCCDLCLAVTVARVSGERAPTFTAEELEKPMDGVLPQYTLLYGPPDKQAEHPLSQEVGGPAPLGKEEGRGPAGADLPMRKGCMSHHDPTDVPHPGGGLSGVGWALEGITAATRGVSRIQPSTSASKSLSSVDPAAPRGSKRAPVRKDTVPPTPAMDQTIPPPAKVKKGPACSRDMDDNPPRKASTKPSADRAKGKTASAKVRKGHKTEGKALQPTEDAGEALVPASRPASPATCTACSTTCSTASSLGTSTATCTATCTAAAVSSSIPSGQPSEAEGEALEPPSTTGSTGTCTKASTSNSPAPSTATSTADSSTTTSSSSPGGRPSKAAGDGLEPPPTTASTDTSTATATTEQPSPPADSVSSCLHGLLWVLAPAKYVGVTPR
ncbi:hypothetical protein NDU88_008110 [Pleurodeles waltl]|uniref:Uncharacterized protein n=1 Tax=Pleurodeles waltl TaxID=8319 RepID=A0AAV7VVQ2_PLEWA|nr:hypothetical protein NDU88_008110 [Pleurodeles waltl]